MEPWMEPHPTLLCWIGWHKTREVERGHKECVRCWKPKRKTKR
jgi:hypothetical protein